MRIIDEAADQNLLCLGYPFQHDSPLWREVALAQFQPGAREKDLWRYHNASSGLRTLVA